MINFILHLFGSLLAVLLIESIYATNIGKILFIISVLNTTVPVNPTPHSSPSLPFVGSAITKATCCLFYFNSMTVATTRLNATRHAAGAVTIYESAT